MEPTLTQIERSDRAWAPAAAVAGLPLARVLTYGLWALVVCAYGYLVAHVAGQEGIDFGHMYSGPKAVLDGVSPYPTSSDPNAYAALDKPYFIFPPGSPLLLTPLGLVTQHQAWIGFSVVITLLAPVALAVILRRIRPEPAWLTPLLLLAVAVALPYQAGLKLGNMDLFCAGLILSGMALMLRPAHDGKEVLGAVLIGLALAVKPTLWPIAIVVLAAVPLRAAIGLIAGAAVPTAIGLLAVPGIDRYFKYVLPELGEGEINVSTNREALGDLARSAGLPHTPTTVLSLLAILAVTIGLIALCRRLPDPTRPWLWRFAPLGGVVPLALLLAPYGLSPYSIYLLVALPFVLIGRRRWMAIALGVGLFAVAADVTLRYSGRLDGLLEWRFLAGLAIISVLALCGLRELLRGRPVLGLSR